MGKLIAIFDGDIEGSQYEMYAERLHSVWAEDEDLALAYTKDLHAWMKERAQQATHDIVVRAPAMVWSDAGQTAPFKYNAGALFYVHPDDLRFFDGRNDAAPDGNGKRIMRVEEVYDVHA